MLILVTVASKQLNQSCCKRCGVKAIAPAQPNVQSTRKLSTAEASFYNIQEKPNYVAPNSSSLRIIKNEELNAKDTLLNKVSRRTPKIKQFLMTRTRCASLIEFIRVVYELSGISN